MFSVEFLNVLRAYELKFIASHLTPGASILEIGGGTGAQARELTALGYHVVSVDLPASGYAQDRVFPIIDYDGRRLPFRDAAFDIVLSSNVLEHVQDLDAAFAEFDRVLKPGGYGVHIMPTGAWRLWTNLANYVELLQRLGPLTVQLLPRGVGRQEARRLLYSARECAKLVLIYARPPRHGEQGNALTEIWTFSRQWWLKHLASRGYAVDSAVPMGVFYTGHMVFGARWSMAFRQRLAGVLGSACVLYRLQRRDRTG